MQPAIRYEQLQPEDRMTIASMQYLPKGSDPSVHSQEDLDAIADRLNGRPRATHGFNTPLAVFSHLLAMAQRSPVLAQPLRVALRS